MKLKILLNIGLSVLVATSVGSLAFIASCATNDSSDYVGNIDGTNWKGYKSGTISYFILDTINNIYTIQCPDGNYHNNYTANNLVIPNHVSASNGGQQYSVIVGVHAFNESHLTGTISLPDTTNIIGDEAFSTSGGGLSGSLKIPSSVISIGSYAFSNSNETTGNMFTGDLIIPDNVTTIGRGAFLHNNFSGALYIPKSVKEIGQNAFDKSILNLQSNCYYSYSNQDSNLWAIEQFSNTTNVELYDGVYGLADNSFDRCTKLPTGLNGVSIIGNFAFYEGSSPGNFVIPNTIVWIGSNAFRRVWYVSSTPPGPRYTLSLSSNLLHIGADAFAECNDIYSLNLSWSNMNNREAGTDAFGGWSNYGPDHPYYVDVPTGSTVSIGDLKGLDSSLWEIRQSS